MTLTSIPFMGFYDSIHSSIIDDYETQEIENINETHNIPCDNIANYIWRNANYRAMHRDYAAAYVDQFISKLQSECDYKIKLSFESLSSPSEYNFTTDRIFCEISGSEVLRLYEAVNTPHLITAAKERFTSRDGFASFYDPDFTTWGNVATWDHNQLETLIAALIAERGNNWCDIELDIATHGMGETVQTTFDKNCDLSELLNPKT